mgnify:CR=1 FL=1
MTTQAPPAGRLAIYPGSFDPPTNGHTDLVRRSLALADRVGDRYEVGMILNPRLSPRQFLRATAKELGGDVMGVVTDVSDPASVQALADRVFERGAQPLGAEGRVGHRVVVHIDRPLITDLQDHARTHG